MRKEKGSIQSFLVLLFPALHSFLPRSSALSDPGLCLKFSLTFNVPEQSYPRCQEAFEAQHSGSHLESSSLLPGTNAMTCSVAVSSVGLGLAAGP